MGKINKESNSNSNMNQSLVQVYNRGNTYNYVEPWRTPKQHKSGGSGFVIENGILTNAHVTAGQSTLEVRLAGDSEKYPAIIKKIDHDCDLALLDVEDPTFWQKAKCLELGDMPKENDNIRVWGFPLNSKSVTNGCISGLSVRHYVHTGAPLIAAQISAAANPGNSGGPVVDSNNKVVAMMHQGLALHYAQNSNHTIPIGVIKHFLEDGLVGKYKGFPTLFIGIQLLNNKNLRRSLFLKDNQSGIRVTAVHPLSSAWGILRTNDVILRINDVKINNDGYVIIGKDKLRIDFSHLITGSYVGDEIKLTVSRNGQEKTLKFTLKNKIGALCLVPLMKHDEQPTYYIKGGLVFQPLTRNYLHDCLNSRNSLPLQLYNINQVKNKNTNYKEVVIISSTISSPQNKGYRDLTNEIVEYVNGCKIGSIEDLIRAFESNAEKHHTVITNSNKTITFPNLKESEERALLKERGKFEKYCSESLLLFSKSIPVSNSKPELPKHDSVSNDDVTSSRFKGSIYGNLQVQVPDSINAMQKKCYAKK